MLSSCISILLIIYFCFVRLIPVVECELCFVICTGHSALCQGFPPQPLCNTRLTQIFPTLRNWLHSEISYSHLAMQAKVDYQEWSCHQINQSSFLKVVCLVKCTSGFFCKGFLLLLLLPSHSRIMLKTFVLMSLFLLHLELCQLWKLWSFMQLLFFHSQHEIAVVYSLCNFFSFEYRSSLYSFGWTVWVLC